MYTKKELLRKLKHAKKRLDGISYLMEDEDTTRHGGWSVGYWAGMVTTIENILDDFYEGWDDE